MKKRRELLPFLALGAVSFICILLTFFLVDPEENFEFSVFSISPVFVFFLFIVLTSCSFSIFLFNNIRRGIIIGGFISALLFLQYLGYLNIFYTIILLLIVIVLDIGLKKR